MESFDMSHPLDQIENSPTKPRQEHDGQMSSGRSQSDVRLESRESQARRVLPSSLIASQRGPVMLLRLSRPAKRNALDDATIAGIEDVGCGVKLRKSQTEQCFPLCPRTRTLLDAVVTLQMCHKRRSQAKHGSNSSMRRLTVLSSNACPHLNGGK
jgi:hypothetical protein